MYGVGKELTQFFYSVRTSGAIHSPNSIGFTENFQRHIFKRFEKCFYKCKNNEIISKKSKHF